MKELISETKKSKFVLKSIGDLLRETFDIYKKGFSQFISLQFFPLLALIPVLLVGVLWAILFYSGSTFNISVEIKLLLKIVLGILTLISMFFAIYYGIIFQIAPYIFIKDFNLTRKISEIAFAGKKYLWPFLAVSMLLGLIVLGGFLLFLIPGFYFMIKYGFAPTIVLFEDKKAKEALVRSGELTRGVWWEIFLRFSIAWIISAAINILFSGLNKYFPANLQDVLSVIGIMIQIIVGPAYLIYGYVIYKNLVSVKS